MPNYPYDEIGTQYDREFVAGLNKNFDEVEQDVREVTEPLKAVLDGEFDSAALATNFEERALEKLAEIQPDFYQFKTDTAAQFEHTANSITDIEFKKVDYAYLDSVIASLSVSGGPRDVFYSIAALKNAFPNGAIGIYLVFDSSLTDGAHMFRWVTNDWIDLGPSGTTAINEDTIDGKMIKQDEMDLSHLNYGIGTIFDGLIQPANNTAIVYDYYYVPKGTVIYPTQGFEFKVYEYDGNNKWSQTVNPSWSTNRVTIERTCYIRWAVRFANGTAFTDPVSVGRSLRIYKTPQMRYLENELREVKTNEVNASRIESGLLDNFFSIADESTAIWVPGTLTPTGSAAESTTRMRTDFIQAKKGSYIELINPILYKFAILQYDENKKFIESYGWNATPGMTVKKDGLIRILFAKISDSSLTSESDITLGKFKMKILKEDKQREYTDKLIEKNLEVGATRLESGLLNTIFDIKTENDVVWSMGTLTGTGGDSPATNRMRTNYIKAKKGTVIEIKNPTEYKFSIYQFDSTYQLLKIYGWTDTPPIKVVDTDGFIRIQFSRNGNTEITPEHYANDKFKMIILDELKGSNALTNDAIYASEYLPEITKTKKAYRNDYASERLGYIFITDLHDDTNSQHTMTMRQIDAVCEIAKTTDIAFVAIGGDLTSGNLADKEVSKDRAREVLEKLHSIGKPIIVVRGNHDDNSHYYTGTAANWGETIPLTNLITPEEWNGYAVSPYLKGKKVDTSRTSTYFYEDIDERKVRVFSLDFIDYGFPKDTNNDGFADKMTTGYGYMGFSDDQIKWFAQSLLDTPLGFNVIVLSHGPTRGELNNGNYTPLFAATINDLMNAFNKKLTNSYGGVDYDFGFGGRTGKIISLSYGHVHADKVTTYPDVGDIPMIATGCSLFRSGEATNPIIGYDYQPNRVRSTISEAIFDVISIKESGVKAIRFGAGEDRVI